MQGLMEGLEAATALQELNLSYTDLGDHRNHHVDVLAGNNNNPVYDTDIHDSSVCGCLELLAQGLKRSQIFCLKLNKCRLSDSQISLLVQYLSSASCSLVTLGLSNALTHTPNASEMEVSDSSSRTQQLSILYPALAANASLRVLHLASNKLKAEDVVPLCSAIAMSKVTMLDLKANNIASDGVKLLAQHLPPKLERLWLLGNPVGTLGARALRDALSKSHVYLKDLRIPVYDRFAVVPEMEQIGKECHFYLLLNQGGRRILLEEEDDNETHQDSGCDDIPSSLQRPKVPQGLWSLVLGRVNRVELVLPWCRYKEYRSEDNNRAEVIFYMLKHSTLLQQQRGQQGD
ncbi:MAG: hypothetical protein SGARI_002037 [Bacillariaceae sp.]